MGWSAPPHPAGLDGGDGLALVHHREGEAGDDAAAVDQHRTGAALAEAASLLGACQMQPVPERIEERGARVDRHMMGLAVDEERDRKGVLGMSHAGACTLAIDLKHRVLLA